MSRKRFQETIQTRAPRGTRKAFKKIAEARELTQSQVQREAFKKFIADFQNQPIEIGAGYKQEAKAA